MGCCEKPKTHLIKVGNSEAGILGFEDMCEHARTSGKSNEEELKTELLALARDNGNYVAASMEEVYKDAFLREYRIFCKQRGAATG
jgi:hypothetical protein